MRSPFKTVLLLGALLTAQTPALAALPEPVAAGVVLDAQWRVLTLPGTTLPLTRFTAASIDGEAALRVQADSSYGHFVHALPAPTALRRLSWRWRVDRGNAQADLRQRRGDDAPLRLCLAFDLPLQQVPFVERQLLRLARSRSAEPLPAATLCYVWNHALPRETVLANAYTARVRLIVLRSQADATGRWFDEERDVEADFRRAFGDEAAAVPGVTALLIGADGDNTGGHTLAYLSRLKVPP